jgi:hypothetical protein
MDTAVTSSMKVVAGNKCKGRCRVIQKGEELHFRWGEV